MREPGTSRQAEDSDLMVRVKDGDERALAAIYDRHGATAYSIAYAILGDAQDAEDAVARAFVQLWQQSERYDPERSPVTAWLNTLVRSRALDLYRARGRRVRALEAAAEEATTHGVAAADRPTGPEEAAWQAQVRARVVGALESLPAEQREPIEMAYFQGLTQSEIAVALDAPLGTVKTRMRSGLQKLKGVLGPQTGCNEP